MQRLFIAIPLPEQIRAQLTLLQPEPSEKIRPVRAEQMHITLHFLGDADPALLMPALGAVSFTSFILRLDRRGHFGNPRQGGVLWIGCNAGAELLSLHRRLATHLARLGINLDGRNFIPHVTLARCKPGTAATAFEAFYRPTLPHIASLRVDRFVLFSSSASPAGSRYTAKAVYLCHDIG